MSAKNTIANLNNNHTGAIAIETGGIPISNDYRHQLVDFLRCSPDQAASRFSKKTVTRPRITRARRDTDIEPVERRLADARYLLLSRRHDKANRRPAQRR